MPDAMNHFYFYFLSHEVNRNPKNQNKHSNRNRLCSPWRII